MKLFVQATLMVAILVFGSVSVFALTMPKPVKVNSGKPVPAIVNDEISAAFLAKLLSKDTGIKEKVLMKFCRKLAKTLSQFTPAEQNEIWYGV